MTIRQESSSRCPHLQQATKRCQPMSTSISLRLVHAHETADPVSDLLLFLELMVPVGR